MELAEFIKDVRFRKNIGGNVKKKEVKQIFKDWIVHSTQFRSQFGRPPCLLSNIYFVFNLSISQ